MKKETKEEKGLLAIWADVDEDYRVEYQKWHNCQQHMTERISIPGFQVRRRYQGIGGVPDFLMYYETDDSKDTLSDRFSPIVKYSSYSCEPRIVNP